MTERTRTDMILITGASGLLGGWLVALLETSRPSKTPFKTTRGTAIDLSDRNATFDLFKSVMPTAVIHAAVFNAADCARDPARAESVNVVGSANVAEACREVNARRLVHVSTDQVFDGEGAPYREDAAVSPTSAYGRTKADAERAVLNAGGAAEAGAGAGGPIVARLPLLFGPTRNERRGFFDQQLDAIREGKPLRLFDDEWRTPLSLRAAAEALIALATSSSSSTTDRIVHLGGPQRLSRYDMGLMLLRALGVASTTSAQIERASRTSVVAANGEPRPRDLSLDSSRFRANHPELAVHDFEAELRLMGVTATR